MMTTNLFVIANVKQLRTGGSFRILLPFFRTSWGVGILNSAIFKSLHKQVEFGTILDGLRYFGGGGVEPAQNPPSVRHFAPTAKLEDQSNLPFWKPAGNLSSIGGPTTSQAVAAAAWLWSSFMHVGPTPFKHRLS